MSLPDMKIRGDGSALDLAQVPPSRIETRSQSGFSLVELVIATGILLLVLMMAGQVLLESQRILLRTTLELRNSPTSFAIALLRQDIHRAAHAESGSLIWSADHLDLSGHPQGRIRYELFGDRLQRSILAADGTVATHRDVLRDVAAWRWRRLSSKLVDVELTVRIHHGPRGYALLDARGPHGRIDLRIESLRAAARGRGLGHGW